MRIPIHSITSLITNSSTTIYTYSHNSENAVKDMFNKILELFNIDKKFDDMFSTVVTLDYSYYYVNYAEKRREEGESLEGITPETNIHQLYADVNEGKLPKPTWFVDAETNETNCYGYYYPTQLNIIPLKPEYEPIAKALIKYLYSTSHEAFRDG